MQNDGLTVASATVLTPVQRVKEGLTINYGLR